MPRLPPPLASLCSSAAASAPAVIISSLARTPWRRPPPPAGIGLVAGKGAGEEAGREVKRAGEGEHGTRAVVRSVLREAVCEPHGGGADGGRQQRERVRPLDAALLVLLDVVALDGAKGIPLMAPMVGNACR